MAKPVGNRSFVFDLHIIGKTSVSLVGGKGANLGELSRIEGVSVPGGFCVSTEAFKMTLVQLPNIQPLLNELSLLEVDDLDQITALSGNIRSIIENAVIPGQISREIHDALLDHREKNAYAVRSSATAEDLPNASFAGQQDTYLNVVGTESVLQYIRKCWASLFTVRACVYRIQNHFDHRKVYISVIVQKMVFPEVAGIMFTADPLTSNRKWLSIDASFGLGEAIVSGLVNADNYKVCSGRIINKKISTKKVAIYASEGGGTKEDTITAALQAKQALTDAEILELERIGRKIENHFGGPQDIEWCYADAKFYILQSRPITTLFPVPEVHDQENHVYLSVGHQQMMTAALKPLGLSFFQLTAAGQMITAGGRLFVDVTRQLSTVAGREILLEVMGRHDPLMKDGIVTIIERGDFLNTPAEEDKNQMADKKKNGVFPPGTQLPDENDPAVVSDLISSGDASVEALKRAIKTKSGAELLDFIVEDIQELKKTLFSPPSSGVIKAGLDAASWLDDKMSEWLGEKSVSDILSQSAPNNVTSEMGLALLDVADVIRPYPEAVDYLQKVKDDDFLEGLRKLKGGKEAEAAICGYLKKYGMRCAGEIDITSPRWSERPATLIPIILSNIKNFEPNASRRKFEEGKTAAIKKEKELLDRLRQLPSGEGKAEETRKMIQSLRKYIGYREYPKYNMISRYFVYKQALLKEAAQLVRAGTLNETEDIYFLRFEELRNVVMGNQADYALIGKRKDEYKRYQQLVPPRVFTSDGEILAGRYKRNNVPPNAIVGLPVSSGIIEGRARVISRIDEAELEEGDILVTAFTDPSWTPLFVSIKGLVTEVGGLMTHGAVIAREYGVAAVVGVENATKLIKDGQQIRVHGTEGYVELL